ncbi:hypothetical protein SJ05684_c10640 [Sinorhizobium sojae CCBAU 05684]|uniref:Putative DnaT-like domain-containing protein n=1 Tax=Sinorhizobium sojae CCBAU 05684 TaxID=716928 RepID=A0A249P9C0_9HYPH|nr:DnaT-like ssDNA-binding protein [Sinorhizobium sojae]ASY62521.1 hypothetical protein SJ05684_c10640 [Sinorhizobium sojae CCBAU 05684]
MAIDVTAGSATAVAYGSAAEAATYFTARGISTWTGTEGDKEEALIRGCDYLERLYAGRWVGVKTSSTQALAWPRAYVNDLDGYPIASDAIPTAIKRANFEAALLILTGTDLEPVLTRGNAIKRKKVKAGPAEVETEYDGGAPTRSTVTSIDGLLTGFITNSNGIDLLRA